MNIKRVTIIVVIIASLIGIIAGVINFKNTYLYMPYEYEESEIFWYEWNELETPLRLEICSFAFEGECVYSTDEEDIKFFIESFWGLEHLSRSREEFEDLNYEFVSSERYLVNIRQLTGANEHGPTGPNLFTIDVYYNQPYIKSPGRMYYYFELPKEVRDFIFNFDKNQ